MATNPDHTVCKAEEMRDRALHIVAGKHRNYDGYYSIIRLSMDQDAMRQILSP
jgi:hypothetical protein